MKNIEIILKDKKMNDKEKLEKLFKIQNFTLKTCHLKYLSVDNLDSSTFIYDKFENACSSKKMDCLKRQNIWKFNFAKKVFSLKQEEYDE